MVVLYRNGDTYKEDKTTQGGTMRVAPCRFMCFGVRRFIRK